jgi:phenylacetic acid degradation operon negative regulatory protein
MPNQDGRRNRARLANRAKMRLIGRLMSNEKARLKRSPLGKPKSESKQRRERASKPESKRPKRAGSPASKAWLRPQSVVFTLLAEHLLDRELGLFSGSFIEVLGRIGIGEHATRSTLARMTRRGLLVGQRKARKSYFRLTPRCTAILEDGRQRIWRTGAVNTREVAHWTLLTFSLPEAWRQKRDDLRARLTWAGFGPLQNGAWLAPAEIDVRPMIEELELGEHVRAFHVQPAPPTDAAAVIRETFDLAALAERYRAFSRAWEQPSKRLRDDPLVLTLRLSTEWLSIIRDDPRVPVHLLPQDWPAIGAQQLFRALHGVTLPAALEQARMLLDLA